MLTRFPYNSSRAVSFFKRSYYNHASIGLNEDMNTFYSFVRKGFLVEKVTKYVKPDVDPYPCCLYELEVDEEIYNSVKKILLDFEAHKDIYRYATVGVAMGIMHIPIKQKQHFFCSYFVAEVLKQSHAATLRKNSALYFPNDLCKLPSVILKYKGNLKSYIYRYAMMPKMA